MLNFDDEKLEQLILDGIVEFAGLDQDGEMLYNFSNDLETKAPAIARMVQELHMQDIYYLWQQGFLSMDPTESSPLVNITERALDEDAVRSLPKELQVLLEQIKEAMRKDF
jgi:hypothetical protein